MTADPNRKVTPEEYLAVDEASETRNELIDGKVIAMSGNTVPHLRVVRNLLRRLDEQLEGGACEVLCNELRVKVELTGDYFYPDLVGFCGVPLYEKPNQLTLLNPVLLIEVLSASTEAYDRGEKFLRYQQICSLKEYVLVSGKEARVEIFTRGENAAWTYKTVAGLDAAVNFESIGCGVGLADIYRGVEFDRNEWELASEE